MTLTSRCMTFCLTVYDSVSSDNESICGDIVFNISIIMSEYGFIQCEYSNIIGNTEVSRTHCEQPL